MKILTMSFTKFFSTPQEDVLQNLSDFQKNIDEANRMMDEIRKQNDYNEIILNKALNNTYVPTPTTPSPTQMSDNSMLQQFIDRGQYHAPQNTPDTGILTPDYWSNFIVDVIKKAFWALWTGFIGVSHWICLLIAIVGIIAYIFGYKKGIYYTGGSIGFYIVIRALNAVMGG